MASFNDDNAWHKLLCVLRRRRDEPPTTLVVDGSPTTSQSATIDALLRQFFPADDPTRDVGDQSRLRQIADQPSLGADDPPFTMDEILDCANSFSPTKAPGPDLLTADVCRRAIAARPDIASAIFNACLRLACFPPMWKSATVICIPKLGKERYDVAKSYRPIGLLSVLGKTLEKAVIRRVE